MKRGLRYAVRRSAGAAALFLVAGCAVPERDYADLNIGNTVGGSSGSAGSEGTGNGGSNDGNGGGNGNGNGGAAGADGSDAGRFDDAGQDSGASGAGGGGTGGSGGGGTGGSGGTGGGGGTGGSNGNGECGAAAICVPAVPGGWTGPIMVSDASGVTSCPSGFPTPQGNVNSGLNAPAANCGCTCFVSNVDCYIESANTTERINPVGECDSPPSEDDCLTAQLSTACTPTGSQAVTPISWTTQRLTCGGATSTDSCSGGSCFPSAGAFGQVCISLNADVACPSEFPNRTLYFRSVTDTRSCSACNCSTQGHSCEITLEVCSLGFYEITLSTETGNEECLNSGDGDGLTLLSTSTGTGGTCTTTGGSAQGSAVPANPVTVCCL